MTKKPASTLTVIKLGGSVLTGREAIVEAAAAVATRAGDHATRLLIVVSARLAETDSLLAEARAISATPDDAALDLLWSTGELRSVALLTLALKTRGIDAVGLNVHEAGLRASDEGASLNPIALQPRSRHSVVVVPGFLATRGIAWSRSDAAGSTCRRAARHPASRRSVRARQGRGRHFTADPHVDPAATLDSVARFPVALELANEGCPLVQRQAIVRRA
jgi:aspartate kinase